MKLFGIQIGNASTIDVATLVQGVDVSFWDTTWSPNADGSGRRYKANFSLVGKKYKFVLHKVSGTGTVRNYPDIGANMAIADSTNNGFDLGTYHFYSTTVEPISQALYFLERSANFVDGKWVYTHQIPPILDYECYVNYYDRHDAQRNVYTWLSFVEKATGIRPIIYTGLPYWNNLGNPSWAADYDLWLAQYRNNVNKLTLPKPWTRWTLWQYTDKGPVAGLLGDVDKNYFNGDELAYIAWKNARRTPWIPPAYPKRLQVQVNGLRIRLRPDTNSTIVGKLNIGDIRYVYEEITSANSTWCRISEDGSVVQNWVARIYDGMVFGKFI